MRECRRGIEPPASAACPVTLWDVFGEQGHPVRATVSDMGPLLLARMLNLNDTQAGVLNLMFKIADDNGMLVLDLKDLRAMLQHIGDNASQFTTEYGNISAASVGAIQRGLMQIETQGGDKFFGEPMLDINDFMQTADGKGVVNVLAAVVLIPHRKGDANMRAVWLFSRNDAIGNLAVVAAAAVVWFTGSQWPDLIVAFAVAALFLQSAWSIIRDARSDLKQAGK